MSHHYSAICDRSNLSSFNFLLSICVGKLKFSKTPLIFATLVRLANHSAQASAVSWRPSARGAFASSTPRISAMSLAFLVTVAGSSDSRSPAAGPPAARSNARCRGPPRRPSLPFPRPASLLACFRRSCNPGLTGRHVLAPASSFDLRPFAGGSPREACLPGARAFFFLGGTSSSADGDVDSTSSSSVSAAEVAGELDRVCFSFLVALLFLNVFQTFLLLRTLLRCPGLSRNL
jgi:hypothetical protein